MSEHSPEGALYRASHLQTQWAQAVRIGLILIALVGNAVLSSNSALACLGLLGWSLIGFHFLRGVRGSQVPIKTFLLVGVPLIFSRLIFGLFHSDFIADWERLGLRFISGLAWLSLFSTVVSWSDLKRFFSRWAALQELVDFADSSVAHGFILFRELERRRETAYLRLFRAGKRRLGIQELSWAMAGGLDQALDRMTCVEESRTLRIPQNLQLLASITAVERNNEESISHSNVILQFSEVQVTSNGVHRLEDCSFTLKSNEWVAVAGPSGAGKTTLLRAISGLTPISSGNLNQLGQSLTGREALHHRVNSKIGLVCQDPHEQILGSTPLEDIRLGLKARGVSDVESERRALEVMESLSVRDLAHRPITRLSFGERKRVAFAAVLVCEPDILLCDEPTSGLDPMAARNLIRLLEKVSVTRTMSVLWATHDWNRLPQKIERVLLLKQGRLVFDGPRSEGLGSKRLIEAGLEFEEGTLHG